MALCLITDRTAADVTKLKTLKTKINTSGWSSLTVAEKALWAEGKGAHNAEDLNRVEAAVAYLENILMEYGYRVDTTSFVTTWTAGSASTDPSEFNEVDAARYLANLNTIKTAFYGTTSLPVTMNSLSTEDLNNMERLLLEVETYITLMVAGFKKCGTYKSGQGVILP